MVMEFGIVKKCKVNVKKKGGAGGGRSVRLEREGERKGKARRRQVCGGERRGCCWVEGRGRGSR